MVFKNLNILVIDDSISVRISMAEELAMLGYQVYTAASREETEKILENHIVDIVFLDLKLPGVTGLEYLEQIRRREENIVVIIMTAYESMPTAVEAIEKGAHEYIIKPISPGHLELVMKQALMRFCLEQERDMANDKRMDVIKRFNSDLKDAEALKQALKAQVNSLLGELGRPPKYK
ncbi:MAG: response regulator [Candidatus Omnitrophota bacterium]